MAVYGAAQDEHKAEFLAELVRLCENETLPLLVGGDFIYREGRRTKIMIILTLDGPLSLMRS
jgi:hypothetical protein